MRRKWNLRAKLNLLRGSSSVHSLAASNYLSHDGKVLGTLDATADAFEIFRQENGVSVSEKIEWADIAKLRWVSERCELRITFVDPQFSELIFQLPENHSEKFLHIVRERVEHSLVCQLSQILPSGKKVTGQVRRNADGTLFTQIDVPHEISQEDANSVLSFENELRQEVGLEIVTLENTFPETPEKSALYCGDTHKGEK
ncbi:hypothetical protein [Arcanobacterium hippocoleae]|uniref:Uncharacterized protein n=1 Tax=Arcanobacterium hippocoleae TaxID=149017 RepID=A0ABU1T0S7_9ACTO|nr:hypothetical protein [Arcanobacterium hippocoleae]MDR6938978.1 hypothetical protein [Arcanobacterium hippocoleae]